MSRPDESRTAEVPKDSMEWTAMMPLEAEVFRGLRARRTSWKKLLFHSLWRWFMASLLLASICIVLRVYSSRSVLDKPSKRVFNAIVTGLSMCVGLAVMEGMVKVARDLRWWILSRRPRSRQKVEGILRSDSMLHVVRLAIHSRRWSVHLTALLWVSLLLSTQAAIASLGLFYSIEKATNVALFAPGNVSIPDLSRITTDKVVKSPTSQLSGQQYVANSYGTIALAWAPSTEDNRPQPGQIWASDDPLIYCGTGSCVYVFHEISTASLDAKSELTVTVSTERSASAKSTCTSWPVLEGGKGRNDHIVIRVNGANQTVPLPAKAGVDQTTFMTNVTTNCGEGCSTVTALEASDTNPWYYICNVTVSDTVNASRPEHHLPVQLRQLASASIALQGYDSLSFINDTSLQYRIYPAESIFGFPANGSVDDMAAILNMFTAGSIAVTAEGNNKLVVPGNAPHLGVRLQVEHWPYISIVIIYVAGVQLVLGIVAAFIASRVVIPEGGSADEAQVIRSMGPAPASASSRRPHSECPESRENWIYRVQEVRPGIYDLYMDQVQNHSPPRVSAGN